MKRLMLALTGLGMLALAAGCCCHRPNPCNPCGPVYGASYSAPMAAPVAYYPGATIAASPGCNCNATTF